jgi:hypothetical protein
MFRFSELMPEQPSNRGERKGIMHSNGTCVDESDVLNGTIVPCYCACVRRDSEEVHDDQVPTPGLALASAANHLRQQAQGSTCYESWSVCETESWNV